MNYLWHSWDVPMIWRVLKPVFADSMDSLYLRVAQIPRSRDLAIFEPMTTTMQDRHTNWSLHTLCACMCCKKWAKQNLKVNVMNQHQNFLANNNKKKMKHSNAKPSEYCATSAIAGYESEVGMGKNITSIYRRTVFNCEFLWLCSRQVKSNNESNEAL